MTPDQIYRRAIEVFTPARQVLKALEEVPEYAAAISRYFANDSENLSQAALRYQLIGEMADVEITRQQVMLMANISPEELNAEIARKLARLERLIGERTDSGTVSK